MSLDTNAFRADAVADETRQFNQALQGAMAPLLRVPESAPQLRAVMEQTMAALAGGNVYVSPLAEEQTIRGSHGQDVHLRLFRPKNPSGTALLYIHGGGWTIGDRAGQDARLEAMANGHGITVASVGYRLAPEHPFPACLDDCADAMHWFLTDGRRQLGAKRLAVAGQSAGSNLVVSALIRARDAGLPMPAAAALGCGAYDLTLTPSARRKGNPAGSLGTDLLAWFYEQYEPEAEKRRDPEISPLYADLRGLPPALFVTGTEDILLDDSLFMHGRWLASGNEAELFVGPGADHAFEGMPFPLGQQAEAKMIAHILGQR